MAEAFDPYRKWLGIPVDEQPPDHYRLLGVPRFESDPEVIENAAHRQMAYVRTFQSGRHAAESQELLNELATAKVWLLTLEKKQEYDETLRRQLCGPPSEATVAVSRPQFPVKSSKERIVVSSPLRRAIPKHVLLWTPILSGLGAISLIVAAVMTYVAVQRPALESTFDSAEPTRVAPKSATIESAKTVTPARIPGREDRFRQQLASLREALGRRDLSRLRAISSVASRSERNTQTKDEIEQIQALGRYVDEFWKSAQRGLEKTRQQLHSPGAVNVELYDHVLEIIEVDGDKVTYRAGDESRVAKLWELPSLDAAALAWHGRKDDDLFGQVYVAAFLCVDQRGDHVENLRCARHIADELAKQSDTPFPFLERELQRAAQASSLTRSE